MSKEAKPTPKKEKMLPSFLPVLLLPKKQFVTLIENTERKMAESKIEALKLSGISR